jgi:transposase-like protein
MSRTRRTSEDFKAKVVLEALKEKDTIEVLEKYELLPNQISMEVRRIRNFLQFSAENGRCQR